ncbi:MAG: hypothetical protein WD029_01540 [Microthrixaceae bacterium]
MSNTQDLRAARHAALGDRVRLAIVDELIVSDRSPKDLQAMFGLGSNLMAHHLSVLEHVGLIHRSVSSGDARRKYVHLNTQAMSTIESSGRAPDLDVPVGPTLFLCTRNSARSQLAAALWKKLAQGQAESAGTDPAASIDPRAVDAAKRSSLVLGSASPQELSQVEMQPVLVITVCDLAHEDLFFGDLPDKQSHLRTARWLHWSIPDPVKNGTPQAFDEVVKELTDRVTALVERVGQAA